jgi:hypothetical protein
MRRAWIRRITIVAAAWVMFCGVATPEDPAGQKYSPAELKDIVGPVALYPDVVLNALLPASAYADQIAEAAQWLASQPAGTNKAPADSKWDGSVQALFQYPEVLPWLAQNMEWVKQLGWAISVQMADVLTAIQAFRKEAQDAGNLKTDEHMTVTTGEESATGGVSGDEDVIYIESTSPETVYIPSYDYSSMGSSGAYWGWGAGIALGAMGAWAFHNLAWGSHHGGGNINYVGPSYSHGGNTNVGTSRPGGWTPPSQGGQRPGKPSQLPNRGPGGAGGPGKPGGIGGPGGAGGPGKPGGIGGPGGAGRPGGPGGPGGAGGIGGPGGAGRPGGPGGPGGAGRPGGPGGPGGAGRPGGPGGGVSRPGGAAPNVPGQLPGRAGGAGGAGSRGGASRTPRANPGSSAFGGSRGGGDAARRASSRGSSSLSRGGSSSRGYSGRSSGGGGRASGGSRGGGSRGGGGGRGGGGRGGGGRRR